MDKLTHYREVIKAILTDHASIRSSNGQVHREVVVDSVHDHYELMAIGWEGQQRVHGTIIHVDIINGKFWIQYDGTNRPVTDSLLEAGVPNDDIVLAFHPENVRQHTGFAVS